MSDAPKRLLRDALRRTAATPASGCIDAATLAAWADGSLGRSTCAAIESHAANCERCLALLAAMTRTAPPAAARRRWTATVRWLVPVAAAAAAFALWVAVPQRRLGGPAPAAGTPAGSQVAETATPSAPPATSPATRDAAVRPGAQSTDRTEPPRRTHSANGQAATRAGQLRAAAGGAQAAPAPEAAPAARPFAAANNERAAAPGAPADAPAEARADRSAPASPTASTPDATSSRVQQRAAAAAPRATFESAPAGPVVRELSKAGPGREIVSPEGGVRWRISGTNVERSGDAGATWQTQSTGVTAALTAGAAPSPTVCWVVGVAGTVVRSVDGRTWQRLPFPEATDLRAVRASDAAHAVVTAADGRTFATVDGGRTWQANGR